MGDYLSETLKHLPFYVPLKAGDGPRRKQRMRPEASRTFVKPLRQSLFQDARLMPGSVRLIALLAGWAGHGRAIETNLGTLARHLGRSVRQVQRYLQDAMEEGYLRVTRTANRMGMITGLRIAVNRASVFAQDREENTMAGRKNPARTQKADIKTNTYISLNEASDFDQSLKAICERNAIPYQIMSKPPL